MVHFVITNIEENVGMLRLKIIYVDYVELGGLGYKDLIGRRLITGFPFFLNILEFFLLLSFAILPLIFISFSYFF